MKLTMALSVRQFLAKIHPPLPKTHRESQQLINVLESSFRKHLDETHPAPNRKEDSDALHRDIPLASTESSSNVARQHFTSILTHPFLGQTSAGRAHGKTLMRHAVERYQRAFVQGEVTVSVLGSCIREYCEGLRNGEQIDPNSRLGPLLASWLSSTEFAQQELFFLTNSLLSRALAIVAAEGDEATVWNWLRIAYERNRAGSNAQRKPLSHPGWLTAEDHLVSSLMRYSIRRKGFGDAVQQFVKACQYRIDSGRANVTPSDKSAEMAFKPMMHSWNRLVAAVLFIRKQHNISPAQFDALLHFSPGWQASPLLSEPLLSIYHPTSPAAQVLCIKLKNASSADAFTTELQRSSPAMKRAVLVALLDGAQLSTEQNLQGNARFLMSFVGTQFSEFLSTRSALEQSNTHARMTAIWNTLRPQTSHLQWHTLPAT